MVIGPQVVKSFLPSSLGRRMVHEDYQEVGVIRRYRSMLNRTSKRMAGYFALDSAPIVVAVVGGLVFMSTLI